MKPLITAIALCALTTPVLAHDYSSDDFWRQQRREARNWADNALHEGGRIKGTQRYRVYRPGEVHHYRPEEWRLRAPARDYERGQVYGYSAPLNSLPEASGEACKAPIEMTGPERGNEDDAFRDAVHMWQAKTSWLIGERYLNFDNAVLLMRRCGRTSTNESFGAKWAERIAKRAQGALGTKEDGVRHRCQIVARPCIAPVSADDGK